MRRITESFLHEQPLVPPLLTVYLSTSVSVNLLHQTFGLISNVVDLFNSSQIQQNSAIKRGEAELDGLNGKVIFLLDVSPLNGAVVVHIEQIKGLVRHLQEVLSLTPHFLAQQLPKINTVTIFQNISPLPLHEFSMFR